MLAFWGGRVSVAVPVTPQNPTVYTVGYFWLGLCETKGDHDETVFWQKASFPITIHPTTHPHQSIIPVLWAIRVNLPPV